MGGKHELEVHVEDGREVEGGIVMAGIKSATIKGVLQDWDLRDVRFDIEKVKLEVPTFLLDSFYDEEIKNMIEYGYWGGDDWSPLALVVQNLIELGWFKPSSGWEMEDPCELKLVIEEE